jgi:hypothetical protein
MEAWKQRVLDEEKQLQVQFDVMQEYRQVLLDHILNDFK